MKLSSLIPTPLEVGRETIIIIGGAIVAAWLIHRYPAIGAYVRSAWNPPPGTQGPVVS
jgi:hypothetical protein